jgi:hypothetical protein
VEARLTASPLAIVASLAVLLVPPGSPPLAEPLLDGSGLAARAGTLAFATRDGGRLDAVTYRATGFDAERGPIWFVIHGAGRTAESYRDAAAPVAERYAALAIAPVFPESEYPDSDSWTLDPDVHSEVERAFEQVREALGGAQDGYYLFGHSAGAQFVHRLLTFLPDAHVLGAVAANAGWYTLPRDDRDFPYGLRGTTLGDDDLRSLVGARLAVLAGERDVATADQDALLRGTPEAMAQGGTRLARARTYFAEGEARARALGVALGWRFAIVPGAAHDKDEVMPSAGFFLFDPEPSPCRPSTAADAAHLVVTEICADPAAGRAGDANGDGARDAAADEFVELVNDGAAPLCLAGWTLGDADDPERHRFPLGHAIPPGGALVVFGGGTPTGTFGGAEVQWASFAGSLDLTNRGDVLTLRDASGAVVAQISWGHRDGAAPAREDLGRSLELDGSIVRWPEPDGPWTAHREVGAGASSPGTRVGGAPWR